jgi:hypothetical protein
MRQNADPDSTASITTRKSSVVRSIGRSFEFGALRIRGLRGYGAEALLATMNMRRSGAIAAILLRAIAATLVKIILYGDAVKCWICDGRRSLCRVPENAADVAVQPCPSRPLPGPHYP